MTLAFILWELKLHRFKNATFCKIRDYNSNKFASNYTRAQVHLLTSILRKFHNSSSYTFEVTCDTNQSTYGQCGALTA